MHPTQSLPHLALRKGTYVHPIQTCVERVFLGVSGGWRVNCSQGGCTYAAAVTAATAATTATATTADALVSTGASHGYQICPLIAI